MDAPALPQNQEKDEQAFSENVTILVKEDKTYYIIGTAHISRKSVEEVRDVIEQVRPDTVCVELCETRYNAMINEDHWKKLNIIQVIRQGKALMLLANLALSSFQRKMGEQMGVKPGAELKEGVDAANDVGAKLVLADREIQITLKRTWRNLSFWKKFLVISGLLESVIFSEKMSEEDLEKMKERDQLSDMMEEFAKAMPSVKEPLIDERDQFLMSKVEEAEGEKVVAVVGAGHVAGMTRHFGKPVDRERINTPPPPSRFLGVFKWVIPVVILAMFAKGYYDHQGETFQQMLYSWILPNSIGAGLFAIIARAKIITVVAAVLAAPLTSLVPLIGAGMVAGLVEAYLRKPTVQDCEHIPDDIKTIGGFYRNQFTSVLLVFLLTYLVSGIGTLIGASLLSRFL
jgi:pheromone shutdown-related protein TraB